MMRVYVSHTHPGQEYVLNTALPTGAPGGEFSFYSQPRGGRGRAQRHLVPLSKVRAVYARLGMS